MKKYILWSLLWLFSLVSAFASADTVWNFSSDSTINSLVLDSAVSVYVEDMLWVDSNIRDFYMCISTSDIPYYYKYLDWYDNFPIEFVSSSNYCSTTKYTFWDNTIEFYSDEEQEDYLSLNWTFYFSSSPITYSTNSWWWNIDEDDNWNIISNGISAFGGIIDKLWNISWEFVPYLLYIWIGILGITLVIAVVKNLIWYMKWQAMWSFRWWRYDREWMKARRTRRRRNRRFGRFLRKNYKNYTPKFWQYWYQSRRE